MPKPRIVLTGGGTAGHVMPHLAMLDAYKEFEVHYIGGKGVEKKLVTEAGVSFHEISTGKLRRYFSVENFKDLFRIVLGFLQSLQILLELRPKFIFSKGGFVSVPVAWAGACLRIPVVTHESDLTPGLATKLILPFAKKVFYTFEETRGFLPPQKSVKTGTPIRKFLLQGDRTRGLRLCGFDPEDSRPVLLVVGGSSGAQRLNTRLLSNVEALRESFRVIHLAGKDGDRGEDSKGYKGFGFVTEELADLIALADLVITRAGANAITEFLTLQKPMLLVPLYVGSRGDQVLNAQSFVDHGFAHVIDERSWTDKAFVQEVRLAFANRAKMQESMRTAHLADPERIILQELCLLVE